MTRILYLFIITTIILSAFVVVHSVRACSDPNDCPTDPCPTCGTGGSSAPIPPPPDCISCKEGGGGGGVESHTTYLCTNPKPLTANGKIKQQCDVNSYDGFPTPCYTGWSGTTQAGGTCSYANDPCMSSTFGSSPGRCGGFTGKDAGVGAGPCVLTPDGGACESNGSFGLPGGYCTRVGNREDGFECNYNINLCATPNTEQSCWAQIGDGGAMNCYWYCPNGQYVPPVTPTPTPIPAYKTVTVTGTLHNQTGTGAAAQCSTYSGSSPTVTLTPTANASVIHPACTASGSTYTCTITYDNSTIDATENFTLTANSPKSGTGTWHTANSCTGTISTSLNVTADLKSPKTYDNTNANTDIFFHVDPWMKAKDTSLYTPGLGFTMIPSNAQPFDSTGDDPGNPVLIDGASGVIASESTLPTGVPLSSPYQWSTTGYQKTTGFNFDTFYSYIQSRKQYKILTSLSSDLHEINEDATDHIFYFDASENPLTITNAPTNATVLLVKGSVVISNNLSSTGFALITNGTITVSPSVNSLQGVYISSAFDTGSSANGLKIKGNLVTSSTTNGRDLTNNLKPSVFVDFDAGQYINLLPYLSISKYDQTIR